MPPPLHTTASTGLKASMRALRWKGAEAPREASGLHRITGTLLRDAQDAAITSAPLFCAVVASTIEGMRAWIASR